MTAVFAHRGCTEGFTENTLEAFAEARRLGADGVELDVRLTADGALAVHHDAEIPGLGADRRPGGGRPARPRAAPGRRPGRLRRHGGQRRDQERPPGPGVGRRRGRGGPHGGGHRGGRVDRPGHRLVVPGHDAPRRAGGRRAPGARRALGLRGRTGAGPRRGRRGRVPGRPPLRDVGHPRAGGAGARGRPGRQRVDGQRAGRPAGDGRARGGHGDHRPAPRRPRRRGRPRAAEARRRACHRAEWRHTAPVHKDGRP